MLKKKEKIEQKEKKYREDQENRAQAIKAARRQHFLTWIIPNFFKTLIVVVFMLCYFLNLSHQLYVLDKVRNISTNLQSIHTILIVTYSI